MASRPQTPKAQRALVDLTLSPLSPIRRFIKPNDLGGDGPLSTLEDLDIIQIGRELEEVKTADVTKLEPSEPAYPIIHLTKCTEEGLNIKEVEWVTDIPSWPRTSTGGVAHVVQVHGMNKEEVGKLVQYGVKKTQSREVFSTFLNCKVKLVEMDCSGVRRCEYLHPSLQGPQERVGAQWERRIANVRAQLYAHQRAHPQNANTEAFATVIQKLFHQERDACRPANPNSNLPPCPGGPRVKEKWSSDMNKWNYHVSCTAYRKDDGYKHYCKNTPSQCRPHDVQYLNNLLSHGYNGPLQYCTTIQKQTGRRRECKQPHAQGVGQMIATDCSVKFYWLVPKDLNTTPYVVFASQGVHQHPPPPPTTTPGWIKAKIQEIIQKENTLTLTCASLKQSQLLKDYLRENEKEFLSDVHESLENNSVIAKWIAKERLLKYPEGTDIAGVYFEYQCHHVPRSPNSFIQAFSDNEDGVMIICFNEDQADLFMAHKSITCDMTYKRIAGEMTEVVFTIFHEPGNRSICVVRAYVDRNTQVMYLLLFQTLFRALYAVTNKVVEFVHIHQGRGFEVLIVDMCFKQVEGWGMFLAKEFPHAKMTWQEHIQHTVIYCLVHNDRATRKSIGPSHKHLNRYLALPSLSTRAEVEELIAIGKKDPAACGWAKHREISWVISGLNINYTKIRKDIFLKQRRDTNINESVHHKTNQVGIRQSLLAAVLCGNEIDTREIHSVSTILNTGIEMSWQDNSPFSRIRNSLRRKDRQNQARALAASEEDPESPTARQKGKAKEKRPRSDTQAHQAEIDILERKERQLALARQEFELQKAKEEWELEKKRSEWAIGQSRGNGDSDNAK